MAYIPTCSVVWTTSGNGRWECQGVMDQINANDTWDSITALQNQIDALTTGSGAPFDPSSLDPALLTGAFSAGFGVVLFFYLSTIGVRVLLDLIKRG